MCVHTGVGVLAVLEITTPGEGANTGSMSLPPCPTLQGFLLWAWSPWLQLWEAHRGLLHKVGRAREASPGSVFVPPAPSPRRVMRVHNTWHLVKIKSTVNEKQDCLAHRRWIIKSRGSLE